MPDIDMSNTILNNLTVQKYLIRELGPLICADNERALAKFKADLIEVYGKGVEYIWDEEIAKIKDYQASINARPQCALARLHACIFSRLHVPALNGLATIQVGNIETPAIVTYLANSGNMVRVKPTDVHDAVEMEFRYKEGEWRQRGAKFTELHLGYARSQYEVTR